ncbi:hypothetical protein [Desulfitobacterium dehalogenans]|uniref:hypothetical protein n=1 Tax=Desulfitobacterium dehalogenans TaxID=36854 RepID=UPI0011D1F9F1|nr:hypothetical protein [Desulfitobacterium dehalogenans]
MKGVAMWTGWTGGGQQEKIRCPLLKPCDTKDFRAEVDRWTAKTQLSANLALSTVTKFMGVEKLILLKIAKLLSTCPLPSPKRYAARVCEVDT